jgi:two-component system cell cycle response regulator
MNSPCPKDIIAKVTEVGSLPQTLAAVLKTINNPDAAAHDIADVISRDVSLTSRVLRMVNSAQFGRRRKVTKISEAVIIMGLNSIKVLTLSSSVFGMVADKELFERCNIKRIWRHLIETASNARSIAIEIGYKEPEEAFVAGILHDLGIILMLLYYREKYLSVVDRMNIDKKGIEAAERSMFGMTHGEVGAEMTGNWKLPSNLTYVVQNHHSLSSGIMPEEATLNNIVALADLMTIGPFDNFAPDIERNIEFIQSACRTINLSNEAVNQIRKESILESIKLAEYLDLDIGDILEILTEANDKLAELYFSLQKIYIEKRNLQSLLKETVAEEAI